MMHKGVYTVPIGGRGMPMVHIRDIDEAAAIELERRVKAPQTY